MFIRRILNKLTITKDVKSQNLNDITLLSHAFEHSPVTVVITDTDGKILYANSKFSTLTGFSIEETLGKTPEVVKSGHHSKEFYQELWNTISSGETWKGEFLNKKKDGTLYWEKASIAPIFDEKGIIKNYVAIKEDITEQKEAQETLKHSEEELKKLNATKDRFFSIIAHDIRNPLSALLGFTTLLKKKYNTLDELRKEVFINNIVEATKALHLLIEDLLQWAHAHSNKIKWEKEYISIDKITQENILLLERHASNKKITLSSSIPKDTKVFSNKNMVSTIIRNILSNAIKFTPEQGTVTVSSKELEDFIEIKINDTGVGIDEENLSKLFKIEERYKTPGTNNEKGTGLGLLVCKEFVEKNGGEIKVESELGKGTSIYFTIPKQPA